MNSTGAPALGNGDAGIEIRGASGNFSSSSNIIGGYAVGVRLTAGATKNQVVVNAIDQNQLVGVELDDSALSNLVQSNA